MTYPHRPGGTALARPVSQPQNGQWTARRSPFAPKVPAPAPLQVTKMRRIEALALMPNGDLAEVISGERSNEMREGRSHGHLPLGRERRLGSFNGRVVVSGAQFREPLGHLAPGDRPMARIDGDRTVSDPIEILPVDR